MKQLIETSIKKNKNLIIWNDITKEPIVLKKIVTGYSTISSASHMFGIELVIKQNAVSLP